MLLAHHVSTCQQQYHWNYQEHSSPIHQRLSQHYMLVFHPIFHCTVHQCSYNFMNNICSDASSHVAVIGVSRSGKWPRFTGCSKTSHCREKDVFFSSQGFNTLTKKIFFFSSTLSWAWHISLRPTSIGSIPQCRRPLAPLHHHSPLFRS